MGDATEVKYLLAFFAQAREAQWGQVPRSLAPLWADTHGEVDTDTNQPFRLLALILYAHLYRRPPEFADADELLAEIRTLLDWVSEAGLWEDRNIFLPTYGDGDSLGSYHSFDKEIIASSNYKGVISQEFDVGLSQVLARRVFNQRSLQQNLEDSLI